MKTILILVISFIQVTVGFTQITITNQQVIQPNDSVYLSYLDTTGFSAGNSGANVLWDYSSVPVIQFNAYLYKYLSASNSVCFSDTVNIYEPDGFYSFPDYRYDYYFVDSTQLTYKGFCQSDPPWNSGKQTYTDPALLMSLPFNYLDSFTDSSIGILQGGSPLAIWQTNGTITKHYDAYGELRLPWVTLPNTARLQTTYYTKDTIINSTMGGGEVRIYSTVGYEWYDLNTHGAVLQYGEHTSTYIPFGGVPTTTFVKLFYAQANSLLGIKENNSSQTNFKIFPNPSNGLINIETPLKFQKEKHLRLLVYDNLGKVIIDKKILRDTPIINLDLSARTKGLYCISLSNGKEVVTSKIAIE